MVIKMKKNILFGLIFILLMSSVLANSELGYFTQKEEVQLLQICDSCSYVNLNSVSFPNGSVSFINKNMTKNSYTFNYTFSDTEQMGEYSYFICGDKDGVVCEEIIFTINGNGLNSNNFNQTGSILALILIVAILLVFAFKLDDIHINLKLFFMYMTFLFGVGALNFIRASSLYLTSPAVINTVVTLYRVSTLILYIFTAYIVIYYVYVLFMWINDNLIKKK